MAEIHRCKRPGKYFGIYSGFRAIITHQESLQERPLVTQLVINALSLLFGQVSVRLSRFFLVLFITRYFGSATYGEYLTIASLQLVFETLSDFGLSNLLVREIARNPGCAVQYAKDCLFLKIALSFIAFACLVATAYCLSYTPRMLFLVCLSGLSIPFNTLTAVFMSVLVGQERMHISSLCSTLTQGISVVLNVLALTMGMGLQGVFISNAVVSGCAFIFIFRFVRKRYLKGMYVWKFDYVTLELLALLRKAFPFLSIAILGSLYIRTEVVMLTTFSGVTETGWFGAALRPLEAIMVVPTAFFAAFYPRVSRYYYEDSAAKIQEYYQKSLGIMISVAMPITIIVTVYPYRLSEILYGISSEAVPQSFVILSWVCLIALINSPVTNLICGSNQLPYALRYIFMGFLIRIALDIVFISRYGYIGACFCVLASALVDFFINCFLIEKFGIIRLSIFFFARIFLLPVIASLLMLLYLISNANCSSSLAIVLATGLFIYTVVLFGPTIFRALFRGDSANP